MPKTVSSGFVRGVADGYSLSRPHGDLRGRDFPAVRDSESADTVVIDGDVLGGSAILFLGVIYVDVVDQLRHHAPGDLRGVGIVPDSLKKGINVHSLALALFQLQPESFDFLGVLPLLLLIPLGHFRKPGIAYLLIHVVLINFLEQHIQFFVPRQQPVKLPLFPGPVIVRHLCGLAHDGFEKIILVLVGKAGQPVHFIKHNLFQKFHPDIVGLGAFPQAGIVVLATKEFDIVVALVEMEVEISPALWAFQNAGKYAGLLGNSRALAACPLFQILYLFPRRAVYDGFMDIEEDRPVFFRGFDAFFHLVGLRESFEVDNVAAILLGGKYLLDGGMTPFGGFHSAFKPAPVRSPAPPVVGGIANPVPLQRGGSFRQPIAVQGHLINAAYHGGGLLVDHPKAGIVGVFDVAVGRR